MKDGSRKALTSSLMKTTRDVSGTSRSTGPTTTSVLWMNVNLCKFNVLRLRYDPGTKTTSFIAE